MGRVCGYECWNTDAPEEVGACAEPEGAPEEVGACTWSACVGYSCAGCKVHNSVGYIAHDDLYSRFYCVQCWEAWDGVEPGSYVPLEPPPPPSACADCGRHEDSLSGQEDDARIDGQDGVFYCGPCADVRRNAFIDELIRSVRERRSVREGAVCM